MFINKEGTILGPKGAETIVSMSALVEVGFEVSWKSGNIEIKRGEDEFLEVQMVSGLPMLEDERCLKLMEEIEAFRKAKVKAMRAEKQEDEKGFRIGSIWEQLKKLLIWLMKNDINKGVEFLKLCIVRRRNEILEDEKNHGTEGSYACSDEGTRNLEGKDYSH